MKRIVLISAFIFCGLSAFTQGFYFPNNVTVRGEHKQRVKVDSTFLGPTGCGYPSLNGSAAYGMFAVYYDTCGHHFYVYDPSTATWDSLTRGATISTAVTVFDSVSQIDAYISPSTVAILVKDSLRGGIFLKYSGSSAVDGGMIFEDGLGQKWIRNGVDEVNINWFGAKTDGSDNRQKIIDAIESAKLNLPKVKIYVPSGEYYVSDSIELTTLVHIYGDGNESYLRFAAHKKGLVFAYPGSQYSVLKNISIIGEGSSATGDSTLWDNSKHGIIVRSPVDFDGVWVRYFDGCGIYMDNDLTSSYPGNSNTSTFHDCHIYNNLLHGIFLRGGDANAITINNCDIVANGGAGIMDRSFLGNNYSGNHTATNGSPEIRAQRGLVKSGGTVYACIKDTTVGIAPPNATYWQDLGTAWLAFPYVDNYNASRTYFAVGSYIFEGLNQYGVMAGNYAETDQAPGFVDQGNVMIGGGGFSSRAQYPTIIYSNTGKLTTKSFLQSEHGIGSKWFYGGNMGNTLDNYSTYPTYSGAVLGSSDTHALLDFFDNGTEIGQFYSDANAVNYYGAAGKDLKFYTNASGATPKLSILSGGKVGVNTASPDSSFTVSGSGHFTTNVAIDGKLTVTGAIDPTHLYLDEQSGNPGGVANKGILYTKDVATKTELFYQSSDGTVTQLSPASSGSADSATFYTVYRSDTSRSNIYSSIGGKQATLVSGTNIKTINGSTLLGSGDLTVTGADSALFYTVYRSDTSRTNIYSAINGKQAAGSYAVTTNNLSDLSNSATARTNLGIGSVENTALSTWAGSTNLTTIGTIATGVWNGTAIGDSYISSSSNWNTAHTDRLKWDGGATGLTAATGRTSLGGTTIGQNIFTSTNPSAVTFLRANADNTVDWLTAATYRSAIGAGTGNGDLVSTNNLSDVSNAGTARTNLGLAIGSNVQAYDADLTTWAGITPSANIQSFNGAATYSAARVLLFPSLTGNTLKTLRVNAGETDVEWATATGSGDMLATNNLSDVANTTTARNNILPSKTGNSLKYLRVNAGETDYELATVSGSGDMILASVQSVTGLKTFDKDKLAMKGTSTGVTTFSTANTSATDYTVTFPAANLTAAQLTYLTTAASAATASTLMLRDANANVSVNNIVDAYTSTATAAGTTTLTVSSDFYQNFSGSSTQTVTLPDATTLTNGHQFFIMDNSTGNLTVNMNGGSLLRTVPAGQYIIVTLTNNGTAAGTWTVNASTPQTEFIRQSATYTLTSTTNVQKLFNASTNGALTVKAATTYTFEGVINLNTMSATSGNLKFDVLGAGTATLTSAGWSAIGLDNTTIGTAAAHGGSYTATNVSSGNITTAAPGTAMYARIKGTITVNAGGTIIPSVGLTTANAAVVGVNTWMSFTEVLPAATNYTPGWN